jgi:hypothetical protein
MEDHGGDAHNTAEANGDAMLRVAIEVERLALHGHPDDRYHVVLVPGEIKTAAPVHFRPTVQFHTPGSVILEHPGDHHIDWQGVTIRFTHTDQGALAFSAECLSELVGRGHAATMDEAFRVATRAVVEDDVARSLPADEFTPDQQRLMADVLTDFALNPDTDD